ncbi:MAG: hypothetical protein ABIR98_14340 [Usitatibacter sp.]
MLVVVVVELGALLVVDSLVTVPLPTGVSILVVEVVEVGASGVVTTVVDFSVMVGGGVTMVVVDFSTTGGGVVVVVVELLVLAGRSQPMTRVAAARADTRGRSFMAFPEMKKLWERVGVNPTTMHDACHLHFAPQTTCE